MPAQLMEFATNEGNVPVVHPRREIAQITLSGAAAATAGNYSVFFVVPGTETGTAAATKDLYEVTAIRWRQETLGTDAGAVSFDVYKVPSGAIIGGGGITGPITAATNNLKANLRVSNAPALTSVIADRRLKPGDCLALLSTGTLTSVSNLSVSVELKRIPVQI
jgi:hypothetical protein